MKKLILTLFIIFLTITSGLNTISAENTTQTNVTGENEEENKLKIKNEENREGEIVSANENGNYNIEFDDGYNGYCINYGDHEAKKGHNFTVQDTSFAINKESKKSVGNELKTFFVEYYDIAMNDVKATQHTIWYFTNNFESWRVDQELLDNITKKSSEKIIPDHGAVKKINNTTEAVFSFEVLAAHESGHQNFFAYKIIYRNIEEIIENITDNNSPNLSISPIKNETENTTDKNSPNLSISPIKNETENITSQENKIDLKNETENVTSSENKKHGNDLLENNKQTTAIKDNDDVKQAMNKHVTGYNFIPALIILLVGALLLIKYTRD